ncbi:MAG TPA: FAD-binding oxidoreductase [Silvibacterium sp.]|nr:FAD-binding oxidoreductase [Silvibacterium sp.]
MDVNSLQSQFRGELLTPGSAQYDDSRKIWNAMIDRRPTLIARCTGPADVIAAIRFALDQDLYPAIRGGGHNVAGLAMVEDGLVVDLTRMKGIFVDPASRTATAQMGLTWGEFDRETQLYGLATTGGLISTTGIAGLTLGGGVGWLMNRCGLVCDNTLSYDIVLANGNLIRATANEHADLFWALKGGGGNFGVVTSITYSMHRISTVISGMVLHPLAHARKVLEFYRDFVASGLPDELTVYASALSTPDGRPVIALIPSWCGDDLAHGERMLDPLRKFGSPIADMINTMPYSAMQQMLDPVAPFGFRSYWKSRYLRELPDAAIDTFVQFAESSTSPRSLAILEHAHGAVSRVQPDATAFPTRRDSFDLVLISVWSDAAEDAHHIEWTRSFHSAMQPWSAGSVYVNSLDQDDAARVPEAYAQNYARLSTIKAAYDPDNRFRRNQNIQPQKKAGSV